ncbi:MAG: LysR family transcriptional regulator [Xenophilus sp.]
MADLSTLKDFLVLCQTKSFSRAAERCHVSVSGLSRRIQGLEQWVGVPLFDRHKTALEVTDAGHRLHAVATEVVYAMEGLRKSVREDRSIEQWRIRFAAPHIMSAVFFPDWIPRLHEDFKDAKFSVDSDNLPECLALLDEGKVDYVVALLDERNAVATRLGLSPEGGDYLSLELGDEQLVPVTAPNAAGQPLFDLGSNGSRPLSFLGYADECHLGWSLQPALLTHGLNLQRNHGASLTEGLRFMALSKLGVAWLPQTLVREDLAAKRLVRAGSPAFDVPLHLTLLRRPAPLAAQAQRLWDFLEGLACKPQCQDESVPVLA